MKSTVSRKHRNRRMDEENVMSKEPVKVYCRLRPLSEPTDQSCINVISDTTIFLRPPESASTYRNINNNRALKRTFSHVFNQNASQREVFNLVARPLIDNLFNGRNSLLFTYGVTGSGKTYTMSGNDCEPGIVPRCLNVIFNSLTHCQAQNYVFKPDKLNSFDVQSETDALVDKNKENEQQTGFLAYRNEKSRRPPKVDVNGKNVWTRSNEAQAQSLPIDQDNSYAVFLTYIEIYNNSVHDLLEPKEGKTKIIREDGQGNMYVHGGTEIEVKSSEEASEIFKQGQRKRHVAHTALNSESSRSHTVFTIRLIQAPLDDKGEQVVQNKEIITVSQLSLVDLAGSERSTRSKNAGHRLREAGNINNSLMTLRSCLEILRENQIEGTNKIVPYRDCKLTHLFKNYFDGDGNVRMIVCINPSVDNYDETIQVMKFAEVSQEVQLLINDIPSKFELGYMPGRRRAFKIFKEATNRLEKRGCTDAANLEVDLGLVYSLSCAFPDMDLTSPDNEQIITALMRFLELRIQKRNVLRKNLKVKQDNFRDMLVKMERENQSLRIENSTLKAANDQQEKKISALEAHVCKTESQVDTLLYRLNSANDAIRKMQQQQQQQQLKNVNERAKRDNIYPHRDIDTETDKGCRELENKLRKQRKLLEGNQQNVKLEIREPLASNGDDGDDDTVAPPAEKGSETLSTGDVEICSPNVKVMTPILRSSRTERIPVVNLRYRRSQSADRWLDHRPSRLAPVGTILQPVIRNKISVNQLTKPKYITEKASRYCLVAQEQDTDGQLETKLYKGDILPTSGGGAQVVFHDVEQLKQVSPVATRKRSSYNQLQKKDDFSLPTNTVPLEYNLKKPRV